MAQSPQGQGKATAIRDRMGAVTGSPDPDPMSLEDPDPKQDGSFTQQHSGDQDCQAVAPGERLGSAGGSPDCLGFQIRKELARCAGPLRAYMRTLVRGQLSTVGMTQPKNVPITGCKENPAQVCLHACVCMHLCVEGG